MSETDKYFEDFVQLPYVLLKTSGYDFLDKPKPWLQKVSMHAYFLLSFVCCAYSTYLVAVEMLDVILDGAQGLPILLRLILDLNYNVIGILKTCFFFRHLKVNRKLFQQFHGIFPTSLEDRRAYRVNEIFWPRWITTMLYLYFCAGSLIVFSPLVSSFIGYAMALAKVGYAEAEFGYHKKYEEQDYVIDHRNPLAYIVIYALETMSAHFSIVFNLCSDVWLVAYAIQLCMHFDYISRSLESYEPSEVRSVQDATFISRLVQKHQVLLELAGSLSDIFRLLILVMLFSTVVLLFCAGVYLITQGVGKDVIGYVAFLPAHTAQYFMVCYYGQQIINKSLEIGVAAYSQTWYNGCQSYKKSILTIMGRAQRQCELNAGGFQTTDLRAFEQVMRMTYQLFMLWRTTMNE